MTLEIAPVQSERRLLVGEEVRIQFKLVHAETGRSLADLGPLQVLVFEPFAGWQGSRQAHPVDGGLYETTTPVSPAGPCYLFFSCPELRIGYAQLPHLIVDASPGGTSVVCRTAEADCGDENPS